MEISNDLLNTQQVADILGVPVSKISSLIREGKLPPYNFGINEKRFWTRDFLSRYSDFDFSINANKCINNEDTKSINAEIPTDEDLVDLIWDTPFAQKVHSKNEDDFKSGVRAALNMIRIFQPNRTQTELADFLKTYSTFTLSCTEKCYGTKLSYLCGILAGITFVSEGMSDKKEWQTKVAVCLATTAFMPEQVIKKRIQKKK